MLLFVYTLLISTQIFKMLIFFLPSYNPFKLILYCYICFVKLVTQDQIKNCLDPGLANLGFRNTG